MLESFVKIDLRKKGEIMVDLQKDMMEMGKKARLAANIMADASTDTKNQALKNMAKYLREEAKFILTENEKDISKAKEKNLDAPMVERLLLNEKRIEAIAQSLEMIAGLPDPVGREMDKWDRPNGLNITRLSTPIGVIGIIYESRPNVTADAGALAMKAGNSVILRGGSESFYSSGAIHKCLIKGLESVELPADTIQLVQTTNRDAVGYMLKDMTDYIDMIIPRGGKSLVARIQNEARVPVLAHLEGICHSYIHKDADKEKALELVLNAKMRRTSVCGATETILIDKDFADTKNILEKLSEAGCEIRGCVETCKIFSKAILATEDDWHTEYLDAIVSVKIVSDYNEAIDHIAKYSSSHTESIITENKEVAEIFLKRVQSSIVMHNASTQFADGGEFGMGAEIGIATGKIHARGPVGLEQLTCFKYQVRGTGQIRPV